MSDKIHSAGEADVDAAVAAASKAFKGEWAKWDPTARAEAMLKFAGLLRQHAGEIAKLETQCMGSAVGTQTMGYNVGADLFTYYAGLADKIHGETSYPTSAGKYKIIQKEPIGVCSGIGAWNVSAVLFAWKAAVSFHNSPYLARSMLTSSCAACPRSWQHLHLQAIREGPARRPCPRQADQGGLPSRCHQHHQRHWQDWSTHGLAHGNPTDRLHR